MPIGGEWFATEFEMVGGGGLDAAVMKRINNAAKPENWPREKMVLNPLTGKVTSGERFPDEFQAGCERVKAQQAARVVIEAARIDTINSATPVALAA